VIEILETATGRRLPTDLGPFVNSLNAVKFSPDSRTIYTGAGDNGDLTAWDATTGAVRFQKTHGDLPSISSLDVSADGQWIATCGMKERLSNGVNLHVATLWDAHTGEPVRDFYDHDRPLWTQRVAISPDSRLLAVAGKRLGNEVVTEMWDVKSGKRIAEVRPAGEWEMWPICMRFSSDSKSLFTLNATSYARRWNAITGVLEKEFFAAETRSNPQSIHWINGAAIAPDYRTIVSSEKRSLHTWNLGSGDLVSVIEMPEPGKQRSFNELAISGDGRLLAAVEIVNSPDANGGVHHIGSSVIRIYDRTTGRELQNLDTGNRNATGLDFSSYGNRLASVMSDGTALVWDLSLAQRRLHQ
jgi:WD40 repeat protein